MSQHHKLVCGSLFVFFAATHAGCAGSGLKNMFTRNETDGYHSLDELETEDQKVASSEIAADEVEKPSMATRLASWRPFSSAEATEGETSASIDTAITDEDSGDTGTSRRFLGRGFTKQGSVEPDPFLGAEPKLAGAGGPESPSFNAVPNQETAKIRDKSKKVEDEFVFGAGPKTKSPTQTGTGSGKGQRHSESTDVDATAVALEATRNANSSRSGDDEADVLAERFEQHFLLSSTGTAAEAETKATATGNELRQKILARAEARKRELANLEDREINQFDLLLTSDSDADGNTSEFGIEAVAEPLQSSRRSSSTAEQPGNSLAEFDQLMGTKGDDASHGETVGTKTAARTSKKKASEHVVNVADAEALFGAAAARQNTRLTQSETAHHTESSDRHADRSSVWSQASENLEGIETVDSLQGNSGSPSDRSRSDVAGAFASHLSGTTGHGKARIQNAAFGAPPASAGIVQDDDHSAREMPEIRLRNTSAFSNEHRVVTANYGTDQPNVVRQLAGTDTSTVGHVQLTEAPVAPESDSEVTASATRPGLVQSFSIRNWLLLIGGVIVIALLFAPGRTKPLTMNSRTANG